MLDIASGSKIGELDGSWSTFADHVEFAPDGKSILVVAGGRVFVTSSDLAGASRDIGEPGTVYVGATFSRESDRMAALTSDGKVEIREGEVLDDLLLATEAIPIVDADATFVEGTPPFSWGVGSNDTEWNLGQWG